MIISIIRIFTFTSLLNSWVAYASTAKDAFNNGQFAFAANKALDAIQWWETALFLDPTLQVLPNFIYRNLAAVNFQLERWEPAFGYYVLALEKESEKIPLDSIKKLAMVCMEMAALDAKDGEFEQSTQYNLLAKKYFEMFLNKNTEPLSVLLHVDISHVYHSAGDYEKALVWHQKTYDLAQKTNTPLPEAFMASYFFLMKNLQTIPN